MNVTKGKIETAQKIILYGVEGIGKSTLASKFPKPLFVDTEGSTKHLNVARTDRPTSWAMLMDQVQKIKQDHMGYQTLVIDTADWAEQLCVKEVCDRSQKKGIEDFGYGKGYIYLAEEFARLLHLLEDIIQSGMHVVITAHAMMRKFEQPDEMGSYDRWELKLMRKTAPLLTEWADMVLFANYKTYVVNVDGQGTDKGKNKAQGGHRVLYTTHHVAWDAKNRHGLKEELELDFSSIAHLFKNTPISAAAPSKQEQAPPLALVPETTNESEQEVPDLSAYVGLPGPLAQLMTSNDVSEEEIRKVVSKKGYYPESTPIKSYDEKFINGALIGAWEQVFDAIKEMRGTK